MFFITTIIVSIIGLLIATHTDLKERIVPNNLNFGLAITGLVIYGIQTIFENNILPITYSLFGLIFGFMFGWFLWKIGVFAGGDVKLFMALGALNPFTPALIKIDLLTNFNMPIFPISLFIYSLIAFLPYGFFIITKKILENKIERKKIFNDLREKSFVAIHTAFFLTGLHITLTFLLPNLNTVIVILINIILITFWFFLKEKKIFATISLIIISLIINLNVFINYLIFSIIILVILFGLIRLLFSLTPLLSKKVFIKDLEEGMIPAKTLVWSGKKVVEKKEFCLKEIIKQIKEKKIIKQKEIISSIKARGLTNEEIIELKKLSKKRLIPKTLLIKDSIPFVPTILLGYLLALVLGDFIIYFILLI